MNRIIKWIIFLVLGVTALLLSLRHIAQVSDVSPDAFEDPFPYEFESKASDDLVLFRELIRAENTVRDIHHSLSDVNEEHAHVSTIFYANNRHDFVQDELDEIARLLNQGASVVVATRFVEENSRWSVTDTLFNLDFSNVRNPDNTFSAEFLNKNVRYTGPKVHSHYSLVNLDEEWEIILSSLSFARNTENVLVAKKKVGAGILYVFDSPTLLTNEILVDEHNWKIPFLILADCYLDHTYFVKYTRYQGPSEDEDSDWSPFDWVSDNPSLASAFWMLIATLSVVYFGKARRRQAVIPTHPEVRNQSVAFNNQIASLYSEKQDHSVILEEALESCLRRIRESRGIEVHVVSQDLAALLQHEAALPAKCAKQLDTLALMLDQKITISDSDFLHFCKTLREVNELIG